MSAVPAVGPVATPSPAPAIDARAVGVAYGAAEVLRDVDLAVAPGEWLALIGPNGAGKSTLLRALAGLVPCTGTVQVGPPVSGRGARRRRARLVAYVPQDPVLPDTMSVRDYVVLGRAAHVPYLGMEGDGDLTVVGEVLEELELVELALRPLGSLSGGERQRATLARAIAQQAPVLLLDEPTSALDVGHQLRVLELVEELRRRRGLTVVCAMHDLTLAASFADRLVLLARGQVVATGEAEAVLTERTLAQHYGVQVRVLRDPDGHLVVIPVRTPAGPAPVAEPRLAWGDPDGPGEVGA